MFITWKNLKNLQFSENFFFTLRNQGILLVFEEEIFGEFYF